MLNLQELEKLNPELDEESALRKKGAGNPLQLMMIQQICQGRPVDPVAGFPELFRNECVKGSGIDPSLYEAAVDFVEDTGRWEPNEALGWKISLNWQKKPHSFGALAGFYGEDGALWQAKPLNPRIEENGSTQKAPKYESPKGGGSPAYLPPVPAEIRQRIAERYGIKEPSDHLKRLHASQGKEVGILNGSFWEWLQRNPSIPIVITEGGKKGLSLLSLGYVGIALYGINGGYRSNEKIAGETIRLERPQLIDSLKPFIVPDIVPARPIILAFDQDAESKTRQKVTAALFKFGALLKSHGAKVSIASWDGNLGKGIDDLQANAGKEAVDAAIANALDFDEWAISHRLANRVKRKPDLHIGDREFVEVAAELPRTGIIALHGGKGTGKSKCIAQMVKGRPWISITGLIALSREQAESFGGDFINDMERGRSGYRQSGGGVAVCVPSLLKARDFPGEVLILDETTAVLKFLLESKLANRDGMRPLLLAEFERRVKEASLVILADADLTEEVIAYIEKIRSEKAYLVRTDRKPLGWKGNFLGGPRTLAIMDLLDSARSLESGKILYVSTDSKKLAETLSELLSQERGIKSLLITQETSGGDIERSFLQSKGADLPSLAMMGIQAIIASPSVVQGFSIEQNTHLIAGFWGFYEGHSIDAVSIAQALDRVRSPIPRNIWIASRGSSYSRFSAALNQNQWLLDFHKSGTATAALAKLSLRSDTLDKVGAIDWQSDNIKLLASFEVERNKGMFALEATVKALLRNEGKSVVTRRLLNDPKEVESFQEKLKDLSERLEEERAAAVSSAQELSGDEVAALERKAQNGTLTQGELLSLERFYISKFYRLPEVASDDVIRDRKGLTRKHIERLEALVIEGRALERTAASINQNPETPQDWDKSELRRMLLQVSGALPLILGILDGTITDLKDEIIAPISAILKKHAKEFAIAFNFRNVDGVEDRQAVFTLLDHYGIKRVSVQITRADGVRDRAYSVDRLHLADLKAVITRRSACTPPPNEEDIQGGCAAPTVLEKLSQSARKTALELLDRLKSAQSPEQQRAIWYRTEENPLQGERMAWGAAWETLESTPEGRAILFNLG